MYVVNGMCYEGHFCILTLTSVCLESDTYPSDDKQLNNLYI